MANVTEVEKRLKKLSVSVEYLQISAAGMFDYFTDQIKALKTNIDELKALCKDDLGEV
jgi:hypothetical protein